jgi:hypothetical protein
MEKLKIEIKSLTKCCIAGVVEPTMEFGSPGSSHEVERACVLELEGSLFEQYCFCPFTRMWAKVNYFT